MRFTCVTLICILITIACNAQQQNYTAFTVNDGLPSNYIYRCIEDNKGFLWVATDAGLARFDGEHFQVFTMRDGLPDNEVLSVVKEKNGRIWANCFKQSPAYFDEIKNRFVNALENTTLSKMKETTGNLYCFPLETGGVMFYGSKGSFILRDKNLTSFPTERGHGFVIKDYDNGTQFELRTSQSNPFQHLIALVRGERVIDSVLIFSTDTYNHITPGTNNGKLYYLNNTKGKCYVYSNFSTNPIRYHVDSVKTPEPFNNFEFTDKYFYLLGCSGPAYLFNKNTLLLDNVVKGNYLINSVYKDNKGNIWVSTIDKGLIVYKKKQFDHIELPANFLGTDFLSIARKTDGALLAGNFYGEVLEARGKKTTKRSIHKTGLIARQRKILIVNNRVITFSEQGIYANYSDSLYSNGKTAIALNDSIILIGQSYGLSKFNLVTRHVRSMNVLNKRVTTLANVGGGIIYFGSTDGLYKYNYNTNTSVPLTGINPLLSERITAICVSADGLVWVATAGSGVVVLKNDKVLLHIGENDGLVNNASRNITTGRPNQIWLGTAGGISVIKYGFHTGKLSYVVQNLTKDDGLTNNVVNEMLYQKDTVYVATGNGITIIPAGTFVPKFNIPMQLVHIRINQRDTILAEGYQLKHDQQNIQMQFAGIELGGHFKNAQYTIDKNKNWINLAGNTLTVELNSGHHIVQLRAVDVNGNISKKPLTISFDVATPFWKAIWFWITLAAITQVFIIYFINRRQKKRKEARLAKEIAGVQTAALEQQAFTSLMNPHFMFNALNSIQHYINLQDRQNANRYLSDFASLIRKNFEGAQQSFIPLEQEMENIKIYLRLEQMRFKERFTYTITLSEELDTDEWMIPTMILQPLLENALLHGIIPSAVDGAIFIDFNEKAGNLLIVITDNGIGIANSLALKAGDEHKSRGMELIKKRVAALSRFGKHAITIAMGPVFNDDRNPGNQIVLFIPQDLYHAWQQAQK